MMRRDKREIGKEIGEQIEKERTIQTIISLCRKHGDTREQTIQELCENCELTIEEVEKKMLIYWK